MAAWTEEYLQSDMLMRITGTTWDGKYITHYCKRELSKKRHENSLEVLHGPARFGITDGKGSLIKEADEMIGGKK